LRRLIKERIAEATARASFRTLSAREQGAKDGRNGVEQPPDWYKTATDLCDWWAGWKAGNKQRLAAESAKGDPDQATARCRATAYEATRSGDRDWKNRRRDYLRGKGVVA